VQNSALSALLALNAILLASVLHSLRALKKKVTHMSQDISALKAAADAMRDAVTANTAAVNSAVAFIQANSGGADPAELQAVVDELTSAGQAIADSDAALAAAIAPKP